MLNIFTGLATDITVAKCTCCLGMLKNYSFSRRVIKHLKFIYVFLTMDTKNN